MSTDARIREIEKQQMELSAELAQLRAASEPMPVKNYRFRIEGGELSLLDLFAGKETLFLIHNMGQGCRYCTLWADGLNAFLPHLEDRFAVALVSKDPPELQRRFANDRGWRFRLASHGDGDYIREQTVAPPGHEGESNFPGMVCYVRQGDRVFRKNASIFGPGDQFASIWHVLSLGGFTEENWVPQYHYWKRPAQLEDGGQGAAE